MLFIQETNSMSFDVLKDSLTKNWFGFVNNIPNIAMALLLMVVGYYLSKKIGALVNSTINKKADDPLLSKFLSNVIRVLLFIVAFSWALNIVGLGGISKYLMTLVAGSAVIVGLAFKEIGENFFSGVILAFKRPFDNDDTIMIDNTIGKVTALEFRYTKIKTLDGKDVYIPNSDVLRKQLINYTEDGVIRYEFIVGVNKEPNIDKIYEAIQNVLDNHKNVAQLPDLTNYIAIDEINDATINLKIFFWVQTKDFQKDALIARGNVIRDVNRAVDDIKTITPTT